MIWLMPRGRELVEGIKIKEFWNLYLLDYKNHQFKTKIWATNFKVNNEAQNCAQDMLRFLEIWASVCLQTLSLYKKKHVVETFFFCLQVIVLQAYKNESEEPIEAKYVFPLDSSAAGISLFTKFPFLILIANHIPYNLIYKPPSRT